MKKLTTLALLLCQALLAFSQPANDDCAGIVDLGEAPICPIPDTFNNVNATTSVVFSNPLDNIPACFTGGVVNRDVWFQFTVPADGSVVDFTVIVTAVSGGPNGAMEQPQVAVYRGDCLLDELQELDCATSPLGEDFVELDLLGLTPGLPYFLRISDWSPSAAPNWGDFVLCVKMYDPEYNMGEDDGSVSCAGTLYDSGGPGGDYQNGEFHTFTICPQDFHQCLFINLEEFSTESGFDYISFYAGDDANAPLLAQFDGFGGGIEIQSFSECVTVQFTSDGSITSSGFTLTWQCTADTCTIPPPSTCDDPTVIGSLPYSASDLSTCYAGNDVTNTPCNNDFIFGTDDFIFTYASPGDECVAISVTGSNFETSLGLFDDCPSTASDCIAVSGGNFGQADPNINAAFLENAGTYYIVVDNASFCTPFNISVEQVACPIVFPSAALCGDALSLNGCGELPAIVSVAPGQGEDGFIQFGVNEGCWGGFPLNFTWFYFTAQEDGEFAFQMQASDPDEASDIDFNIWGPLDNVAGACDFIQFNQPIRSSYAAGADLTGLAATHPFGNYAITDVCEDAGGDDFVSPIDVLEGEVYFVLINDWGNQITSGAVSIDFGETTPGVLDALGANFTVSPDTALCPGQSAQLLATGGEVYQWSPAAGLSCIYCPNPVATVVQATTYSVSVNSVCQSDTLEVLVGLVAVDAGPDQTVCLGEQVQILAGSTFATVSYAWSGPAGFLSCTDCPDPVLIAASAGTHTFTVTATGPGCSFSDQMTFTVLPQQAPTFQISDDQQVCLGETVSVGGPASPGVAYVWASDPPGFVSTQANPSVTPAETTTYYLTATNGSCPLPSLDSVTITVSDIPLLSVASDTTVCLGESVSLGQTQAEPGVTYTWTPPGSLDNPAAANPLATPTSTTQYSVTATRAGCSATETVTVIVTQIGVDITSADTFGICRGLTVPLAATAFPAGVVINWLPGDGSLNTTTGGSVTATPQTATLYTATVQFGGCVKIDSAYVGVDSLPWDLSIAPLDTQVCAGEQVLLTSPTYEPADFSQITFQWSPAAGQLTPDSLFNLVVVPSQNTVYQRIATNGFCSDTSSATVNVVPVASIMVTPSLDTICQGESVQLVVSGDPGVTEFTWTPAANLSCSDCANPLAFPPVTTTFAVEGEFEGCPVGSSATIVVTPGPAYQFPDPPFACPGGQIQLNEFNDPNASYSWTSSDGSLTSSAAQPVVTPTQTTTYTMTATRAACEVTDEVTITVPADFTLTVSPDLESCPGDPVTLTAAASQPGVLFTWTDANGNQLGTGGTFTPSPNSTTTYFVSASDPANCYTHSDDATVTIYNFNLTVSNDTTVGAGEPVTLVAEADIAGISFEWKDAFGTVIGTGPEVTVTSCETTQYKVTATDPAGCQQEEAVTVSIIAGFSVNVLTLTEVQQDSMEMLFEGEEFELSVTTTPAVIPGATYQWFVNDTLVATTSDTTSGVLNAAEIFNGDLQDSLFTYSVQITSDDGCSDDLDLPVVVKNNPVKIPNAFSPDNQEPNNFFVPVSKVPVTLVEFKVWNRWGQLVYDNDLAEQGWDGRQDGDDAPSDVYVYMIKFEITGGSGKQYVEKGDLTLLR